MLPPTTRDTQVSSSSTTSATGVARVQWVAIHHARGPACELHCQRAGRRWNVASAQRVHAWCETPQRISPQVARYPETGSSKKGRKGKPNWRAGAGIIMSSYLRVVACALLLLPAQALAGAKEKIAALAPSGLVLVVDAKGNELAAQNADRPFIPASVTKIVTAWLAMEVLGNEYRFETRFYLDGDRVLYIRGGGD